MQFQIRGLEPFITNSLPIAQFKKNGDEASPSNNECASNQARKQPSTRFWAKPDYLTFPAQSRHYAHLLARYCYTNRYYRDVDTVIPVDAVQKAEIRCSYLDLNKMRIVYQRKR
ncbi:hypothetical protein OIU76_020620 [Salix suchowensis]|nr:hypothetical protein OIU76_020620 [Salix suchowensis]